MNTITVKDGTQIYFKDWGKGQPLVFHHGWPLSADDWDAQMMFFLGQGYRVIAHDRRGHGRSTQTAIGNDLDTSAAASRVGSGPRLSSTTARSGPYERGGVNRRCSGHHPAHPCPHPRRRCRRYRTSTDLTRVSPAGRASRRSFRIQRQRCRGTPATPGTSR
jgi:pimeloyl-ACP methyl ester carboxylesterase